MSAVTVDTLRDRLVACKGHYGTISRDHNISYMWLTKFASGRIPDPRMSSVERLAKALDAFEAGQAGEQPAVVEGAG